MSLFCVKGVVTIACMHVTLCTLAHPTFQLPKNFHPNQAGDYNMLTTAWFCQSVSVDANYAIHPKKSRVVAKKNYFPSISIKACMTHMQTLNITNLFYFPNNFYRSS